MKSILVSEIFGPTIQGEGALIGRPTVFLRTGGCDFRCDWCDTLYAVLPQYKSDWTPKTPEAILEEIEDLSGAPILITVSGGNPALQPLEELIERGHNRGHSFAIETQGSKSPQWLAELDYLVLSPKPPSSKMEFSAESLASCIDVASQGTRQTHISLKVVVFDEDDYQFARRVHQLHPTLPFYLSVGNEAPRNHQEADSSRLTAQLEWLLGRCAQDKWLNPTILPQLHVLLWGNKRGV